MKLMGVSRLALLCALLLFTLGACAPGAVGTTRRNPVTVATGEAVTAAPGEELFVEQRYGLAELGLRPGDFTGALWIPEGLRESSANALPTVRFRGVEAPGGWRWEVVDMRAVRRESASYGRAASATYSVMAVYRVGVPANAELGPTTLRAELAARGGRVLPIELTVRVRAPG